MSVLVTVRPDASVSTATTFGGDIPPTNLVGGADRAAVLRDDSDASYHSAPAGETRVVWIVSLADLVALPAGARIEWVRPKMRALFAVAAGWSQAPAIALYLGPTPDGSRIAPLRALWTVRYSNPAAVTTFTGPEWAQMGTSGSSVNNSRGSSLADWSEDAVDAMTMGVQMGSADSGGEVRLHELYLDVSYRRRGEVVNIAPVSGSTVTESQPTVGWTPVSIDNPGHPQNTVVVRVYHEDVFSLPTFDPWDPVTFPTVWTSGDVLSSTARSIKIGERLKDGERYRAYIFVAQPWSGTQDRWWSAKPGTSTFAGRGDPFYTEFVIDTPAMTGPSLTAVANDAKASVELRTTGFVPSVGEPISYEFERSDDGGTTWVALRSSPVSIDDPTSPYAIEDHEGRRGRLLQYRARAVTDLNTSEWDVAHTSLACQDVRLKDPVDASRNRIVRMIAPFKPARQRPQTNFDVLGREDAVTTSEGFKGWAGESTFQTETLQEYEDLDELLGSGRVLLLQDGIGRQWYIEVGDSTPYEHLRGVPTSQDRQFPVRHLNRTTVSWRSAEAP